MKENVYLQLISCSVTTGNNCLLLLICNVSNRPGWPSFVCTATLTGSSVIRKQKAKY